MAHIVDLEKEFKAGDFTSGKMGDIFRTAFMTSDTTVITHKQFGDAYLIPKSDLEQLAKFIIRSFVGINIELVDGRWVASELDDDETDLSRFSHKEIKSKAQSVLACDFEGVATESSSYQILWYLTDSLYTLHHNEWETLKAYDHIDGVPSKAFDKTGDDNG